MLLHPKWGQMSGYREVSSSLLRRPGGQNLRGESWPRETGEHATG